MAKTSFWLAGLLLVACSSSQVLQEPEFVQTDIGPAVRLGRTSPVKMPKLVRSVDPDYPVELREQSIRGLVRLEALIGPSGKVAGIVPRSGPHELLVKSAIAAVSQWQFEPPLLDGEPVAVVADIYVEFSLDR